MRATAVRRSAMVDNWTAQANTGYLRIYSGTRPADADASIGSAVLLATLRFAATAFQAASGGTATANAITQDGDAVGGAGAPSFARISASDGTTALADVSVGPSGCEVTLAPTSIPAHAIVQCTSCTVNLPVGTA